MKRVSDHVNIAVKERFTSIETQLNNVRKMVIDGGMGPLTCSSDQIKVITMRRVCFKDMTLLFYYHE